ncbi:MAG: aminotransferase class V-fold PLP-dependent enzyme [Bacillota bacterium]
MLSRDVIRGEFPEIDEITYLNNAAYCPVPRRTIERLTRITESLGRPHFEPNVPRALEAARKRLAQLMNAESEEIAFVANTSEGISLAAASLPLQAGDNIIIPDPDHPSLVYPWLNLHSRGVQVRRARWDGPGLETEELLGYADDRTRVIALSHVEWMNGFRHDLRRIGSFCRERGIFLVVDAIQSLGVMPVDVRECHVSVLVAGGYKWLLAGRGNGCIFVNSEMVHKMHPPLVGRHGVSGVRSAGGLDFHPDARRFFTGAWNLPGILALESSVGLLLDCEVEAIAQYVTERTQRLMEGIERLGLQITSHRQPMHRSGIVSFTAGDRAEDGRLVSELAERDVYVALRSRGLRAAVNFYNEQRDIDRIVEVLGNIL